MAAFSADGLHWYKTGKVYHGPKPVWERDPDGGPGALGKHLLLIPLKELDVGLQVRSARVPAQTRALLRDCYAGTAVSPASARLRQRGTVPARLFFHLPCRQLQCRHDACGSCICR